MATMHAGRGGKFDPVTHVDGDTHYIHSRFSGYQRVIVEVTDENLGVHSGLMPLGVATGAWNKVEGDPDTPMFVVCDLCNGGLVERLDVLQARERRGSEATYCSDCRLATGN